MALSVSANPINALFSLLDKKNMVEKIFAPVGTYFMMLKGMFFADYVVLGGGNTKKIEELPEGCRRGGNHNAYFGGLRMWEDVKT